MTERLRFLSDISVHKDGSEQRICLRKGPRQEWDLEIVVENDVRQLLENRYFGAQDAEWEVPVWFEPMYLTEAVSAGDHDLPVALLAYSDFRSGNNMMLGTEAINNCTIGSPNVIHTTTAIANDYPVGTPLYCLRPAKISGQVKVSRYAVNLTKYTTTFCVTDNNIDLADITGWTAFSDKPVLDDPNWMSDTITEGWNNQIFVTDGTTGVFETLSFWKNSRRTTAKGFKSFDRAQLWKFRQLLHWLKGRQKSFYLPTNAPELTASGNLTLAATTLNVVNSGYATYTDSREPRNLIRVALRNGTVYTKSITDAVEIDADTEQLTVDTGWAANVNASDIVRIDILEKSRMDADDVTITHLNCLGEAEITVPVQTVLE